MAVPAECAGAGASHGRGRHEGHRPVWTGRPAARLPAPGRAPWAPAGPRADGGCARRGLGEHLPGMSSEGRPLGTASWRWKQLETRVPSSRGNCNAKEGYIMSVSAVFALSLGTRTAVNGRFVVGRSQEFKDLFAFVLWILHQWQVGSGWLGVRGLNGLPVENMGFCLTEMRGNLGRYTDERERRLQGGNSLGRKMGLCFQLHQLRRTTRLCPVLLPSYSQ